MNNSAWQLKIILFFYFPLFSAFCYAQTSRIDQTLVDYVQINMGEKLYEIKYGDVITGSSDTQDEVGMSLVVLDELNGYYLNSFCSGFRLNDSETLFLEYARYPMRGNQVLSYMFKHVQGSRRSNLFKTTVKEKLKVFLPSLEEQKAISERLELWKNN